MVATRQLTTEDVEQLGAAGERMELIDGELREKAGVSQRHGEIEIQLTIPLGSHVLPTVSAGFTPPTRSSPFFAIRT